MNVLLRVSCCVFLLTIGCSNQQEDKTPPGRRANQAENTDALCSDGVDNDGDGYVDCADTDCANTVAVALCNAESENTSDMCSDGQDNDGDGLADCADPDCEQLGCNEANDEFCSDEVDNDSDGWIDCMDFSCKYGCEVTVCNSEINPENSKAECEDGEDNDGDGRVDCDDYGCQECNEACQVGLGENTLALCSDGLDNDGDGVADCQDTECVRVEGMDACDTGEENTIELCSDGLDNDNDPYIDCADRHCEGLGNCVENTIASCSDTEDNDGDGYVDCLDFDCTGIGECGEATDSKCQDGLDNDGNGYVDCDDFGCRYGCNVTVCPGAEKTALECADNIDNDGDNYLDCADLGCQQCVAACSQDVGENTLELCGDNQDNDQDGAVDCLDMDCVSFFGDLDQCDTGETNCSDGVDNDNDPFIDCTDRDCNNDPACTVTAPAPVEGQVIINEILSDPYGAGDANGDGSESSTNDEFIELVNISGGDLDLSGCSISDGVSLRHSMALGANPQANVLAHHEALVIFAGGTPVGNFGGSKVVVSSSSSLGLNNGADKVTLTCGETVVHMAQYDGANENQSVNRETDGVGDSNFVLHRTVNSVLPYSPGTCADGIPFSVCLN